jgi:hypothetical protein
LAFGIHYSPGAVELRDGVVDSLAKRANRENRVVVGGAQMRLAWKITAQIFSFVATILTLAGMLLAPPPGSPAQQDRKKGSRAGLDMRGEEVSNMGPSMTALMGYRQITPVQPKQAGDEEQAKEIVA